MGRSGSKTFTDKEKKYLCDQLSKKSYRSMNRDSFTYYATDLNAMLWGGMHIRDYKSIQNKLRRIARSWETPTEKVTSEPKRGTIEHVLYLVKQLNHTMSELTTALTTFCNNYKYEQALFVSLKEVREAISKVKPPKP